MGEQQVLMRPISTAVKKNSVWRKAESKTGRNITKDNTEHNKLGGGVKVWKWKTPNRHK
jgi:hypothetical protein